MGRTLAAGDKVMLPPLMPCGECYYCVHYPTRTDRCLNPTCYGRYIPVEQPRQGAQRADHRGRMRR